MPNDATTRLLYAILSQKCLKDIDWNRVASDPILAQEITNGHAARMRYSRFRKQMEGNSTLRRPRNSNPSTPRKKVEKSRAKSSVKKERRGSQTQDDEEEEVGMGRIKIESLEGTPELTLHLKTEDRASTSIGGNDMRSGSEFATPGPMTPRHYSFEESQSQTPSPNHSFRLESEMDLMSSFSNMPLDNAGIYGVYEQAHSGLSQDMSGMGMGGLGMPSIGGGGLYGEMNSASTRGWAAGGEGLGGEADAESVKKEERWDESYHV